MISASGVVLKNSFSSEPFKISSFYYINSFPFPSISNAKRRDIFLDLVVVAEPLSDEDERVEHLLGKVGDGGVVLRARPAHLVS